MSFPQAVVDNSVDNFGKGMKMGFYILCPYFLHEQAKRPTISCEDCIRYFGSVEAKLKHIETYCENDWIHCPAAASLNDMYERIDNMQADEKQKKIELLKSELSLAKENNKRLLADIGREKKKREKADKQIAVMNDAAKANFEQYRRELEALRRKLDNAVIMKEWSEANLANVLINAHPGQSTFELDLKEAATTHSKYVLTAETKEPEGIMIITVRDRATLEKVAYDQV